MAECGLSSSLDRERSITFSGKSLMTNNLIQL